MAGESASAEEIKHRVTHLGCGSSHSMCRLDTGLTLSWGRGEDGQLGHGDAQERTTPCVISALIDSDISKITCGAEYSIATSADKNQLYSWGWGDFGRLGHGQANDVFIPKSVAALAGETVLQVACGDTHTLVTTATGALYSFGRNQNGQLGLGTNDDGMLPRQVEKLKEYWVLSIGAGGEHSVAMVVPRRAHQGIIVSSVAAGAEHSVVSTEGGEVYAWGWGRYGNLGDGFCLDRYEPTKVAGLDDVKITSVCCGWRHSCAIDDKGTIYTFGWSKYGQLGHGDNADQLKPKAIDSLKEKKITIIAGGWRHTVAADADGNLYGWGWNKFGQLGIGHNEDANSPQAITTLAGKKAALVSCGWRHTVAVTDDAEVYSWGRGVNGQLGHGELVDLSVPKRLEKLSYPNLDPDELRRNAGPSSSEVPAADRFAVVPDNSGRGIAEVPEVPQFKKPRNY